jgi:hypothetical protein
MATAPATMAALRIAAVEGDRRGFCRRARMGVGALCGYDTIVMYVWVGRMRHDRGCGGRWCGVHFDWWWGEWVNTGFQLWVGWDLGSQGAQDAGFYLFSETMLGMGRHRPGKTVPK